MRKASLVGLVMMLILCCTVWAQAAEMGNPPGNLDEGVIAGRESISEWTTIPQIDSSTARIPITDAIYALLKDTYRLSGPEPVCSKTHGAWINLADGKADILFTVAPTDEEFQYFQEKGIEIEMKAFGHDGLVFIGNEDNMVENITSDEIRGIYKGEITNWGYLTDGANYADIEAYIRNRESGSQRLFEQLVWTGYDMPDFSNLGFQEGEINPVVTTYLFKYEGMDDITESVMENKFAIGFNIMSYIDDKYLTPSTEPHDTTTQKWMIRATGEVNLRRGPGLSYAVVGTISEGEKLPYLDEYESDDRHVLWYKAEHPTKGTVWISSRYSIEERVFSTNLKLFSIDGFAPTTENFASGNYPFVTTSYVAIRADEPAGSPARQLFDWVGTEESRALIAKNSTLAVSFANPFIIRWGR